MRHLHIAQAMFAGPRVLRPAEHRTQERAVGRCCSARKRPAPIGGQDHARPPISDIYKYMSLLLLFLTINIVIIPVLIHAKSKNDRIMHEFVAAPYPCIPSRIELLSQSAKGAATNALHTMLQVFNGLVEYIHVTLFLFFHL